MSELRFYCYICEETILTGKLAENPLDPCASVLIGHSDREWEHQKEQTFFCHANCFGRIVGGDRFMHIMEPDFGTNGDLEKEDV